MMSLLMKYSGELRMQPKVAVVWKLQLNSVSVILFYQIPNLGKKEAETIVCRHVCPVL